MNALSSPVTTTFIITDLATGGAETMLLRLLSRLDQERFIPSVISLQDHGTLGHHVESLGIPVYDLGMKRGRPTPAALNRLSQLMQELRPAIVQGWMYHGNLAAQLASSLTATRPAVVWNIRHALHDLKSQSKTTVGLIRVGAWLSQRSTAVVYNSRTSASQHEVLGYAPERTRVIPNGFDTQLYKPDPEKRLQLRRALGFGDETPLIGHFGRFHRVKDHRGLLEAAARVVRQAPETHFVLTGRDVEPQNPELSRWIAELALSDHVTLLGERQDVFELLPAFDLAVSSSSSESFPNTIGEAMACGLPCVVTDVGDSRWLIDKTGLAVAPHDPGALSDAMRSLLSLSASQRQAMGRLARRRIEEQFSIHAVVKEYERLYERMITQTTSAPSPSPSPSEPSERSGRTS